MKKTVNVLRALGDENRLRIVMMLMKRPMCVCEINSILDIALSTISAHLKTLKNAGVVDDKKEGRWITYSISEEFAFVPELLALSDMYIRENDTVRKDRAQMDEITRESCSAKMAG